MRKALFALPIAAAAFATPALAQPYEYYPAAPWVAGAAVGTLAGVGLYNGWYTSWGAAGATFPATAAGAAVAGGVIGVGTVVLIDAAVQPCRGFHALFDLNHGRCVYGEYVGDRVAAVGPRHRRVYR